MDKKLTFVRSHGRLALALGFVVVDRGRRHLLELAAMACSTTALKMILVVQPYINTLSMLTKQLN
jgi:hypothetical protein